MKVLHSDTHHSKSLNSQLIIVVHNKAGRQPEANNLVRPFVIPTCATRCGLQLGVKPHKLALLNTSKSTTLPGLANQLSSSPTPLQYWMLGSNLMEAMAGMAY